MCSVTINVFEELDRSSAWNVRSKMKEENGILNASVIVIVSLEVFNHSNSSRQRLTGPMDYAVKLYNRTNNGIWNEPSFIVQFTVVTMKKKKKNSTMRLTLWNIHCRFHWHCHETVTNLQIQWPALYPLIHFTMKFIVRGIKNWFRVEQRPDICARLVSR